MIIQNSSLASNSLVTPSLEFCLFEVTYGSEGSHSQTSSASLTPSSLICRQQEIKSLVSILYDIFFGLELVHHRIHILLASIDLKFSKLGIERCQDIARADDILSDHGFRVISRAQ